MLKPIHLTSAASAAHALVLELYRFTARWPECEREGLTLEVRRTGHALSSCLACADDSLRPRALRRAVDNARGKHARLESLLHLASDLGYRKLSPSAKVDELMDHLHRNLDQLTAALVDHHAEPRHCLRGDRCCLAEGGGKGHGEAGSASHSPRW